MPIRCFVSADARIYGRVYDIRELFHSILTFFWNPIAVCIAYHPSMCAFKSLALIASTIGFLMFIRCISNSYQKLLASPRSPRQRVSRFSFRVLSKSMTAIMVPSQAINMILEQYMSLQWWEELRMVKFEGHFLQRAYVIQHANTGKRTWYQRSNLFTDETWLCLYFLNRVSQREQEEKPTLKWSS